MYVEKNECFLGLDGLLFSKLPKTGKQTKINKGGGYYFVPNDGARKRDGKSYKD